jgi:predicted membrane protein
LDRLGIVGEGLLGRYWPVGIIAIGAVLYLQRRVSGHGVNGLIVMGIGAWLLLNTLGISDVHFWELFWPVVLILIGVTLITQTRRRQTGPSTADDQLTIFAMLGGAKRTSDARHFRGGEITTFMGGCNLDLRQATIPPGEEAVIDMASIMGGSEITVPSGWTVTTPLVAIMGGVEDKRLPPITSTVEGTSALAPPRLVLRGFVFMGGVVIKS